MAMGSQEELPWGVSANCYAYACDCPQPNVGNPPGRTAVPGIQANQPPVNNGNVAQLIAGVLADGGGQVHQCVGTPANIPVCPRGSYLIAMLTSGVGFHFIRRDELTNRWSWKDANLGTVKYNLLDMPNQRYVYVNDGNLNDLLVTNPNNYMWMYNNMTFQAFFSVPNGGIVVGG